MSKNYYQKRKEEARKEATDWQLHLPEHNYSAEELKEFDKYFTKLGRKFGLIQEFREMGIIKWEWMIWKELKSFRT